MVRLERVKLETESWLSEPLLILKTSVTQFSIKFAESRSAGSLLGETYSELRGPHLSHGSFLLRTEGTWEISWMSSSMQQLSVMRGYEND